MNPDQHVVAWISKNIQQIWSQLFEAGLLLMLKLYDKKLKHLREPEYGIYNRCTVMNRPSTVLSRVNNQSGFLSLSKHQPCLGGELTICAQGQL